MSAITTITIFHYPTLRAKLWAFGQMQFAHARLQNIPGMQLYKLMGSGAGNGFSLKPDWSTYALLANWDKLEAAEAFFANSKAYQPFLEQSDRQQQIFLRAVQAHGQWDGQQPFELNGQRAEGERIAVLTRATIATKKLWSFWKEVPAVSRSIDGHPGLLYSKGIGEWPIFQQATISVWENREAMHDFAYKNPMHTEVIKKTRQLGWYTEELFAEFEVLRFSDGKEV